MKLLKFKKFMGFLQKFLQRKLKKRIALFAKLIKLIQLLFLVDICAYVFLVPNIYKIAKNRMQVNVQYVEKKLNNLLD